MVKKILDKLNETKKKKEIYARLKGIYSDLKIRRGPFCGMKYRDFKSTGSALYPKLIGVYEREISDIINISLKNEYEYFIDVGCAEGYYAIGMKKYGKVEKVVAYDIDDYAKQLCKNMATINNVEVEIRHELSEESLASFGFDSRKRSFLIADCEGFERQLFTVKSISNLANVECLIEIHDWCQYENKTRDLLIELFKKTHECKIVEGIDDYDKAYEYRIDELSDFTISERFQIFAEGRRRIGIWLHCIPKN